MQDSEVLLTRQAGILPAASLVESPPASSHEAPAAAYSRFAQRLRRRYAAQLSLLPAGAPVKATMAGVFESLRKDGADTGAALRVLRQLVMERLIVLDCDQQASLKVVTAAMTGLAEFALNAACCQAFSELDALHGAPFSPQFLSEVRSLKHKNFAVALLEKLLKDELKVRSEERRVGKEC